ncbi:MAG: MMPL family transporter [Chloroflexi bacterium]|nr:MMPL family transporter [Chloroflexota bacterium]
MSVFARWGSFVHRFRWPVLAISFAFLVGTGYVAAQGGTLKGGGIIETSESGRALRIMRDELPQSSGSSFTLIFSSPTLRATDAAFKAEVERALADLAKDPRVRSLRTPYETTPPSTRLISNDGRRALAVVAVPDPISEAQKYYEELRGKVRSSSLEVTATGNIAITKDFNDILESDLQRAEIVSLPLALALLVLVFATVVAALIPLGVGILAVVGGVAGTFVLSRYTDVSQYALNVVTLIGLGVAIDYSLFIVNRFREELRRGSSTEDALARAMATTGRAIAFSGLTVAIGLSGMLFYEGTFLSSMGQAGAVVVAFAVVYGLTFLPALLSVLGRRVDIWRVPLPQGREGAGLWHDIATWVMRRPATVLVPVMAAILITATPFLSIRMANGDVTMLPKHAESRRGYDMLVADFAEYDKNQVTVVVRYAGDPLAGDRIPGLVALHEQLAKMPHVLTVESPFGLDPRALGLPAAGPITAQQYKQIYALRDQLPPPLRSALEQAVGKNIAVFSVLTAEPKLSDRAQQLVRDIRAVARPAGAQELLVTGLTAFDIDVVEFIVGRTPVAVAFVMIATYGVLFLLLGSVVLPLKAVVMNLLSIATSFGALVWIFQQGNLSQQLGFTPAPLDPTLPVILFCTVFGLSMDYEVLLLSRIQEEYARTGDNTRAVAEGLERSGRLITGAAAIMVGVFGAFALAEVVIIKAIGLGMALAVAIDATLVRALVVPATMRLLGNVNWWAPGPLARLYRRLALGEAEAARMRPIVVASSDPRSD